MFLVIVLVLLVVVALAATGVLGAGSSLFDERPHDRVGGRPVIVVAAAGLAGVVVLGLAITLLVGRPGTTDDGIAASTTTTTTTTIVETMADEPARRLVHGRVSAVLGPRVQMDAARARAVGGLRSNTVLQMRVAGFPPFAAARALQCAGAECGNVIDVQVGEHGVASFQYLVVDDFAPAAASGRCGLEGTACSILVENIDGEGRAELITLFHDELPDPGRVTVVGSDALADGDEVEVTLDGFTARASLDLVLCASAGDGGCAPSTRVASLTVDAAGAGAATVVVHEGRGCSRDDGCWLAVRSDDSFVRAAPVHLTLAAPPGVDYATGRLAVGLAVGLLLAAVAIFLIRRTDWSPVGEEAAPEIDDVDYADLDAIVAALPPEPDDVFA